MNRHAPLAPAALLALTGALMLVLAAATILAVSVEAPWTVSVPLAAASLAVRPLAARRHRRDHLAATAGPPRAREARPA